MRVAVLYGTTYGSTARVAELVRDRFEARVGARVPCLDVGWTSPADLPALNLLVLGTSTWDDGDLPVDWREAAPALAALDLTRTAVALFGTGDQVAYPGSFVSGMGRLAEAAASAGATLVGAWPAAGYRFRASRALRGRSFVGLPLDEDNQGELSEARIAGWVDAVLQRVPESV